MGNPIIPIEKRVRIRRFALSQCGASATEFALVFPVFMLLVFGIAAFSATLFVENNMINAARESVRQMSVLEVPSAGADVQCDSSQAQTAGTAEYTACTYLTFWGTDFTVNASDNCDEVIVNPSIEPEATVVITLDASQAAIMDIFGFFNDKDLSATVSMRKEDACV